MKTGRRLPCGGIVCLVGPQRSCFAIPHTLRLTREENLIKSRVGEQLRPARIWGPPRGIDVCPNYFLVRLLADGLQTPFEPENYRGVLCLYIRDNIHHIPKTTCRLVKKLCLGRQLDDFWCNPSGRSGGREAHVTLSLMHRCISQEQYFEAPDGLQQTPSMLTKK